MGDAVRGLKKAALVLWVPLARRAGLAYVAGPEIGDAVDACRNFWDAGQRTIVCYWNGEKASPRAVADQSIATIDVFSEVTGEDYYLSIKAPALGFSRALVGEITKRAARSSVRVHFDAQRPEVVSRTRELAESVLGRSAAIGFTLPGRFSRSLRDAEWAIERGIPLRVVKGQVPDPTAPDIDPGQGLLAVVEKLAGRARHVGVASHDAFVVRKALRRLVATRTPCELELLFGLPFEPALREARALGVPVRVYVPFGEARLPYHLTEARRNPRVFSWLVRDLRRGPGWLNSPV